MPASYYALDAARLARRHDVAVHPSGALTLPDERPSVTPYVRLFPPGAALSGLDVGRVLVGHGEPVLDDGGRALTAALARARRGTPRATLPRLPYLVRAAYVAARD